MIRPAMRTMPQQGRTAGASLVTAIFLLVVLAGLGAAMLSISSGQQAGSAMDVRGARAYQAARAGVEWGLFQVLQLNNCPVTNTFIPTAPTLNGFSVTVGCVLTVTPPSPVVLAGTLAVGNTAVNGIVSTAGLRARMRVEGVGIPADTSITAINGANALTIDQAATVNGVSQLTYGFVGASPAAAVAGTLTVNSANVTNIATTGFLASGMRVWGVGIVPGTVIASITNATALTLSNPATAGGVQQLTFRSVTDRWQVTSTACSEPTAAGLCPNPAPTGADYVQRQVRVDF